MGSFMHPRRRAVRPVVCGMEETCIGEELLDEGCATKEPRAYYYIANYGFCLVGHTSSCADNNETTSILDKPTSSCHRRSTLSDTDR